MPETDAIVDNQVKQYIIERPLYESYAAKLQILLVSLLEAHQLKYQIVESRAKDIDSFKEKITRGGKSYKDPMADLPDLCGARIIVYYADDVDKVAKMLSTEFLIVETELSHQQESLEVDRFGYLSFHSIVKLNQGRQVLAEWNFAQAFKAEIQVRTVIQHAWSAVSHALQYKQETAVPSKLRRRLFRIAGLFELADEEFVGIRDAKGKLLSEAATALAHGNKDVSITSETIKELLANDDVMAAVIDAAVEAGFVVDEMSDDDSAIPEIYEISRRLGLKGIGQITELLQLDNQAIFKKYKSKLSKNWSAPQDYFVFFALLNKAGEKVTAKDLENFGWTGGNAERLISAITN